MSWALPRTIGAARARNVILTNRVITADEALDWGIVSEIVDDDQVDVVALERAHALAAGPVNAIRAARTLLSASAGNSLDDHLIAEARSISELSGQPEGIEGVDAFVGKREAELGLGQTPVDRVGAQVLERLVGLAEGPGAEEPAAGRQW